MRRGPRPAAPEAMDASGAGYAEDRAALLQYVLESPTVARNVVWPCADRNAVDARQISGHPIDLYKVDVPEVLRCIREGELIDLSDAVARDSPADRLKRWLPRLCEVREFMPATTELELTAMAYELLLCCTVLKGSNPLREGDEGLMEDYVRVACSFKMRQHRELLRQLQVLGADEQAAASLGEPSSDQPLLYRWLLLRNTSPTRETHEEYQGWCRRQIVFLLVSLLLHLRANPDRRWRLEGVQYELSAEEVEKHLITACQRPLRELSAIDRDGFYSTERYDVAMSELALHMDAIFQQLRSSAGSNIGLPVAAPFSLMLYEVLLRVVFVSDDLTEDGDGGKHPESDALVCLYRRCCWTALGIRSFEHSLAMASVGYGRLITRGANLTEQRGAENYSVGARLGLLRSLVIELEAAETPNLLVRVEKDGPTGIRWQKTTGGESGKWLVDQVSEGSSADLQLRDIGIAGRGLMLVQVNGEAVASKSRDEVLQEISADGRSERTPLELGFKPPSALHAGGSSRSGRGMICGIPILLPCTGADPAAARALASELLRPLDDTCREELSRCCESFDIDTDSSPSVEIGERQATVQAMAALVASASRLRGEDSQESEGRAAEMLSASLHAYCASVVDVSQLEDGDPADVAQLATVLQKFVATGGFAAFANACLPTAQHCMSNRKGRGVQEAYFNLGLLLRQWVDAALLDSVAEESDGGVIAPAVLDMIKSLLLLEQALAQMWKREVSDTDRLPPVFNGRMLTELVEPHIARWVSCRIRDWDKHLQRLLSFEKWEQEGVMPRSQSVSDLMEMLLAPMRMFEGSGLSNAASDEHRGRFVQALAEMVQSYVQQVATGCDSDGTGSLRLPALPRANLPLNEHVTRRSATKQSTEARIGQQDFAAAEEAAVSSLRDVSFASLAMRLNTLDILEKAVKQVLTSFFERHSSIELGDAVSSTINQAISGLAELIGAKAIWVDQRFLLRDLYRTTSKAIDMCNKDIDARGGKKKVEDDMEMTCIPPESVLSVGRPDVLDGINTQLGELEELVVPNLRSVVTAAIFTKFLQVFSHVLINFDYERIFAVVDDTEIFMKDLVRRARSCWDTPLLEAHLPLLTTRARLSCTAKRADPVELTNPECSRWRNRIAPHGFSPHLRRGSEGSRNHSSTT